MNEKRRIRGFGIRKRRLSPTEYRDEHRCRSLEGMADKILENEEQSQKAERRQGRPVKELEYNPDYPWLTEGVNDSNRDEWLAMIHKKNPWLKVA